MSKQVQKVIISVIMPAYNEEKRIAICFHRVVRALEEYGQPFEIILEEDGNTDRTPQIIDNLAGKYAFVKALHFPRRMGKGFGTRMGLEASNGDLIVLLDSDMEYPPERIPDLLRGIDANDVTVGARSLWRNVKNGEVRAIRALLSRIYNVIVKILFKVDPQRIQDLQSGFKAFKRGVIEAIQPITSNGFEIDSEILIKALRKGFKIGFIPVTYTYKGDSKVDIIRDPVKMLLSVLRWKLDEKFRTRGERHLKVRYLGFPMRVTPEKVPIGPSWSPTESGSCIDGQPLSQEINFRVKNLGESQ